jgi:ribonucleoside-triphosphate reductase
MNIELKLNKDFERYLDTLIGEYGEDFELLNGFHNSQLNFSDFIDSFVRKNLAEVTIDNNASSYNKDIVSMRLEKGKPSDKLIAFSKIFQEMKKRWGLATAQEWLRTEWVGGFYLHDAPSTTYTPYCYAYDLGRLAREGLFFMNNYNNKPAQHLTTFTDDVIEYVSFMCNRSSGAVGIPNILVWTMYFWKKDVENGYYIRDPEYYLRQTYQKLIYRLNQPFLRTDQSAFTNVSIFDRYYYEALFGGLTFPDGSFAIDYTETFLEHEKIFMEVVSQVREENMFTFPVLTYSLLKRKNIPQDEIQEMLRTRQFNVFVDNDFARWCSDHNCKWNDSNFFMSDDVTTLSNCCRLLSDTSKLKGFINSIGGTALSIGSIKVNTINLMHIVYELEDELSEAEYLKILRKRTKLCCKVLDRVRHIISRNIEKGLLPNYCDGGIEIDKQYCTVGILGLYEVMVKFGYIETDEFGNKSYTDKGIKFADKIFKVLNEVKDNFTDEYSFNIESVPAERAAVILCGKDSTLYNTNDFEIYSNQWIPLTAKCTINEKVRTAAILDNKCSGGAIAHINLESNFPNTDEAWNMLNYIATSGVIYFCFNTRINVCKHRHAFVGTDICPICGEPVYDTYQRVVGFLTPSKAYSKPRQKEFDARQWYETALIKGQASLIGD